MADRQRGRVRAASADRPLPDAPQCRTGGPRGWGCCPDGGGKALRDRAEARVHGGMEGPGGGAGGGRPGERRPGGRERPGEWRPGGWERLGGRELPGERRRLSARNRPHRTFPSGQLLPRRRRAGSGVRGDGAGGSARRNPPGRGSGGVQPGYHERHQRRHGWNSIDEEIHHRNR